MSTKRVAPEEGEGLIRIIHHSSITEEDLHPAYQLFRRLNSRVASNEREETVWMACEWYVPATIAILIGKPLLGGFLKEVGTSAGKWAVDLFCELYRRARTKDLRFVSHAELEIIISKEKSDDTAVLKNLSQVGKPAVPLELRIIAGDRFVFMADLDDDDICISLKKLPALSDHVEKGAGETRGAGGMMSSSTEEDPEVGATRARTFVFDARKKEWCDSEENMPPKKRGSE